MEKRDRAGSVIPLHLKRAPARENDALNGLAHTRGVPHGEREHNIVKMEINPKGADGKCRKIYFFGHFGSDNFGNEITLQTVVYHVRRRLPEAEIACICTYPKVLAGTQKIESVPISRDFGGSGKCRTGLAGLLRKIFIGGPRELFRWFEAFRILRGADMLIVPGTGLLTDAYGLQSWGPYNLFKWSLMARVCRCRLLFVSVGAGPIYSVLGKYFVKSALSLADFRSYRDDASLNYLKKRGFHTNGDRVYPDLVFSLPGTAMPHVEDRIRRRRVVGLGLMGYAGKYSVAEPSDTIYSQYLETLVVFAHWLLEHDYDIRLLMGDAYDRPVLEEFKSLLKATVGVYDEERMIDQPTHSVQELLPQIAATDIVVVTRFHNVLLALVFNKPVIAISFHHKCAALMSQMGLEAYCHDINRMSAARLIEQFLDLEKKAEQLKPLIRQRAEQSQKALEEQYNLIFKCT
jgi:polysaccharide pyruvyl transferase WcaK-like protein